MRSSVSSPPLASRLSLLLLLAGCDGMDTQPEGTDIVSGLAPGFDAGNLPVGAVPDPLAADGGVRASDAGDAAITVSCPVAPPTSCPDPTAIRYADVAPIIEARCASCHSPLWAGPWPLNTLSHVRDWTDDIRTNLIACTMPPRDAGIPMTQQERLTLLQWIRCGLPE